MRNPTDAAQANNSGIPTLQPIGFGEILDITFSLYRKYFLLFLAIVIIHFFGKLVEYSLENFLSDFPLKNLIVSSVSEPAMFVSMGGIIIATATTYLGKRTTSSAVLRSTLQRFFTMLGGYVLWLLCFVIALSSLGFFCIPCGTRTIFGLIISGSIHRHTDSNLFCSSLAIRGRINFD